MSDTKGHNNKQYIADLWSRRPYSGYGVKKKKCRKMVIRKERQQDKQIIKDELKDKRDA
jgi:hypothetical protein